MEEVFAALFWFVFICIMPIGVIGGVIGWVVYRNRQRTEGSAAIGDALGLSPTIKAKKMQWYEGRLANGRLCAYLPIVFPRSDYRFDGTRRNAYDSAARVVVEVQRERPLDVEVFRHQKWREKQRPFSSFDTAFNEKNGSKLTSSQQQALIAFAQKHHGTLWLGDRDGASADVFNDPSIMGAATSFLLHEFAHFNPTPEQIRTKVNELSTLAGLFEEF